MIYVRFVSHPYFAVPRPTVIGHRGCAGEVPENTLASFARGVADGAHILESDVHITRDGVPVLCHDPEVDRTTNGRGAIVDHDLRALQQLDAGHAFSCGDAFPFRGEGLAIPTLAEAYAAFDPLSELWEPRIWTPAVLRIRGGGQ